MPHKHSISLIALLCVVLASLACSQALQVVERKSINHELIQRGLQTNNRTSNAYVPVFVMLPLAIISNDGHMTDPQLLRNQLAALKSAGVDGVMADVWWGIVERAGPRQYNWGAYQQLVEMVASAGLKIQVVMSFHRCGGNVGDACDIPIPPWVLAVGQSNPDIFYTDHEGHRDTEYLSSGVDNLPLFGGRTPVQMYSDYMSSFAANFSRYLGNTITEIEVGLGPAGELRYPSYQLDRWSFPGVGAFQCYDKYMLADLAAAAKAAGRPEWGNGGPSNAGSYNSRPYDTGFFGNGFENWNSPYGQFFLNWYASALIAHGEAILSKADTIFQPYRNKGLHIAAKIAGIHWWYFTDSHAAELTAGYYNTIFYDGYRAIASMFKKYNTAFAFTCLEMRDSEQRDCGCGPEELVQQTENAAWSFGAKYTGENALERYDQTAYDQIVKQSSRNGHVIDGFTFLRLTQALVSPENLQRFANFVNRMHNI